jgi:hypothetical protein
MRMPLWVQNKATGKYESFPVELLEQFEDGTQGFSALTPQFKDVSEAFQKYRKHFELRTDPTPRYILKEPGMTNTTDLRELSQELYTLDKQYKEASHASVMAQEHALATMIKLNDVQERFDDALAELKSTSPVNTKWWNANQGYSRSYTTTSATKLNTPSTAIPNAPISQPVGATSHNQPYNQPTTTIPKNISPTAKGK